MHGGAYYLKMTKKLQTIPSVQEWQGNNSSRFSKKYGADALRFLENREELFGTT